MSAGVYNASVEQGATYNLRVDYADDQEVAIDISAYTARAYVKVKATDIEPVLEFACSIPTPANGQIFLTLTAEQTEALSLKGKTYLELTKYYYDLELYDISGNVIRVLNGELTISPNITKEVLP